MLARDEKQDKANCGNRLNSFYEDLSSELSFMKIFLCSELLDFALFVHKPIVLYIYFFACLDTAWIPELGSQYLE